MTKLARTLEIESKKALFRIDLFWGDSTQDPITWLEEFERATKANWWSTTH